MAEISQAGRLLAVHSPLGPDVLLLDSFAGSEALSRPFRFDVRLLADIAAGNHLHVQSDQLLGKPMSIRMQLPGARTRFFHGIVKRFSKGHTDERLAHYSAELVPWLSLLTLTSDCRFFRNASVPEILEEVFTEFGFHDFRTALTREYTKWDYCAQYRETAFNFVSRLMEQEGIFYYFEHEQDKHTLVLADSIAAYQESTHQLVVRTGALQVANDEDVILAWEKNQDLISGKYSLRDYHFEMPTTSLEVEEPALPATTANLDLYDYPGEYAQRFSEPGARLEMILAEGKAVAKLRMGEEETNHTMVTGASNCRVLSAGSWYQVSGNGTQDADGTYVLTAIQHGATQTPSYISDAPAEPPVYENSFTCIPSDVPFRPMRVTPKPLIQGPQTACVVDETADPNAPPSEEIWPDKYGRVKVRFPWDRTGKFSCWVRVAQPWAGKGWGQQWIPRVGDEVIVDFIEGDPDCPVIIGSLYNSQNLPPFSLPDNKTQSGIRTRSSHGGGPANFNQIRLEDKKGSEEIHIHAERQLTTVVEASETRSVGGSRSTSIGRDDSLKVGKNQTIVVGVNRDETVGANQSEKIGGSRTQLVMGADAETIALAKALTIGAAYQISVGAALNATVVGAMTEEVGAYRLIKVVEKCSISAKQIAAEGSDEVTLESGAAKVSMKQDGTIEITGTRIVLKAGAGQIEIDPGGIISIKGPMVKINT